MPNATSKPKVRITWPDVAKGISILGVCFLHVVLHVPNTQDTLAEEINRWLGPVRMPLFFLVSGLFAYKVRRFTLWELWHNRLRYLLIPYLVWAPLEIIINKLVNGRPLEAGIIKQVLIGDCATWFLHSLSIFVVFLWLTRFLGDTWSFVLSFLPYLILVATIPHSSTIHVIVYLPVYCLGVFFRPAMLRLAQQIHRWTLWVGSFLLFLAVQYLFENVQWVNAQLRDFGFDFQGSNVHTVLGGLRALGALPFAILMCAAIAQLPRVTRVLTFFGRNTLMLYIGHPIILTLGFKGVVQLFDMRETLETAGPLLMWAAICYGMALCLAAGWIFEQMKRVPLVAKTLDPSLPWQGRRRTPARSSVVSAG